MLPSSGKNVELPTPSRKACLLFASVSLRGSDSVIRKPQVEESRKTNKEAKALNLSVLLALYPDVVREGKKIPLWLKSSF